MLTRITWALLDLLPAKRLEIGERFVIDNRVCLFVQIPWFGGKRVGMFWKGWGDQDNAYDWPPAYPTTRRSTWDEASGEFRDEMRDDTGAWQPARRCSETGEWALAA